MCYGRGIVGNGVGLRKHAETRRHGDAKDPEEESLSPGKRRSKTAKDVVEGFQKIYDLVLHFVDCCESWRASKIQVDARKPFQIHDRVGLFLSFFLNFPRALTSSGLCIRIQPRSPTTVSEAHTK